jgi:hypothetical protein
MAVARRRPGDGLVHHSDRGCLGGFKRSSQHSTGRSCDGRSSEGRSGWAGGDAVVGASAGGSARAPRAVLGGDRARRHE